MIRSLLSKRKVKVKDLQALCGYLNFLCKAIFPGRVFVRRMYSKFSGIINIKWSDQDGSGSKHKGYALKKFHHVKLDQEFKFDCQVWLQFLGKEKTFNQPMLDLHMLQTSDKICFYSDASTAENLGFGCIYGSNWIFGKWEPEFIRKFKPSIECFLHFVQVC